MDFVEMLNTVREDLDLTRTDFAKGIGISKQYFCDMEHRRKSPSAEVINKICAYLGRGPKARREWHVAGARAHGWEV